MGGVANLVGLPVGDDLGLGILVVPLAGVVPDPDQGLALDDSTLRGMRARGDFKIAADVAAARFYGQVDQHCAIRAGLRIRAGDRSFAALVSYGVPLDLVDSDVDGGADRLVVVVLRCDFDAHGIAGLVDVAGWLDAYAEPPVGTHNGGVA